MDRFSRNGGWDSMGIHRSPIAFESDTYRLQEAFASDPVVQTLASPDQLKTRAVVPGTFEKHYKKAKRKYYLSDTAEREREQAYNLGKQEKDEEVEDLRTEYDRAIAASNTTTAQYTKLLKAVEEKGFEVVVVDNKFVLQKVKAAAPGQGSKADAPDQGPV